MARGLGAYAGVDAMARGIAHTVQLEIVERGTGEMRSQMQDEAVQTGTPVGRLIAAGRPPPVSTHGTGLEESGEGVARLLLDWPADACL